jgi:cell division protein FtsQ
VEPGPCTARVAPVGIRRTAAKPPPVVSGGREGRASRSSERVASVVVPLPRARTAGGLDFSGIVPSARMLLSCLAVLAIGLGSFFVARSTGVFAIRTIEVEGAPPGVAREVRSVLRDEEGVSLLRLDREAVRRRVQAVPAVAHVTLDRAFPHTLRLVVVPERPAAVARQGAEAWLLSARGRVLAHLVRGARSNLPRLWIAKGPLFQVGGMAPDELDEPLTAISPLAGMRFPAHVVSVRAGQDELTLVLRSGLELRLGDATAVALKLAVAARVLPLVADGTRYVDVSVPERPVAGSSVQAPATGAQIASGTTDAAASGAGQTLNSQVEVKGATSSSP